MDAAWAADGALAIAWELALFAAAVALVFALEDIAVDALWLGGVGRRIGTFADASPPAPRLSYAVLIPAWQEAAVIGQMLRHLRANWPDERYRVYVGVYSNDLATAQVLAQLVGAAPWLQVVIVPEPGPTTKGHCLNALWQRVAHDRRSGRFAPDAVIIHDAEDMVSPHELAAHDAGLATADYVQLPVLPLVNPAGPWWSGHYLDEFAEAHGKEMPVRQAIGAMLPTAGVGFSVRVAMLERLAGATGPFGERCLTEDYELGIRLARIGARGQLSLVRDPAGQLVATRAYFPHDFASAVRQKKRWLLGIALQGWGRLGWDVPPQADPLDRVMARWMLWRDRRTLVCALALMAGYAAAVLTFVVAVLAPSAVMPAAHLYPVQLLSVVTACILLWRLAMRAAFTARFHGLGQAALSVPRQFLSNMVMIACAWRALFAFARSLRGQPLLWDKTVHYFPRTGERAR